MIQTTAHPLPTAANENANLLRFHELMRRTASIGTYRSRRQLLATDKIAYSADQWRRYSEAFKGLDNSIRLFLPYL